MSGFKDDKLKEKLPKPVPDSKLESERVGLDDALQQIPRFVIVLPPSEIIGISGVTRSNKFSLSKI